VFQRAFLAIVVSAGLVLVADGQKPSLKPSQTAEIDGLVSTYIAKNTVPGATIAIAWKGEVVYTNGYGLADIENAVPARPYTMYRSASMGKTITATTAMELVEQKKIDLEQPIQTYCPAFPAKPWVITTRHLLTHTSGIRHYGGPHDAEEQTSTVHYSDVVQALDPFKNDPLLFEPGTQYSYSTYGFDVLGCVIQGAAHQPFLEVIRNRIFEPAGMKTSRDDDPAAIIPHRAAGYTLVEGKLRNAPHIDMSNRMPAGGYLVTAGDLARFSVEFIDCKFVSCVTRDAMLSEVRLKNGETVNYGLGWGINEDDKGNITGEFMHGGSSPGASGMLYIVPSQRLAVILMTNLDSATERLEIVRSIGKVVVPGT